MAFYSKFESFSFYHVHGLESGLQPCEEIPLEENADSSNSNSKDSFSFSSIHEQFSSGPKSLANENIRWKLWLRYSKRTKQHPWQPEQEKFDGFASKGNGHGIISTKSTSSLPF
jgi:hypothetical protein